MVADQTQILPAFVITEDQHGDPVEIDGIMIPVIIDNDEIEGLLDAYDPAASASPTAADSRVIARVIMDSLKRYIEGA